MTEIKHSGYKIAQSAWFVVSVYLGLVLGDLVQNGIFPTLFGADRPRSLLWLQVATLLFYILCVFESYVWLNPRQDDAVAGREAAFRIFHLFIYIASVLSTSFLALSFTSSSIPVDDRVGTWLRSFALLMALYAVYNIVWIVKRRIAPAATDPGGWAAAGYAGFYLLFSALFHALDSVAAVLGVRKPEYLAAGLFLVYMAAYFTLWWRRWHSRMFETDVQGHYGKVSMKRTDTAPAQAHTPQTREGGSQRRAG